MFGINFQPKKRSILWCDFSGMQVPEIVKKRPVLIIKKHKKNSKLVYVLPISNSEPTKILPYHFKLNQNFCDMYFKKIEHWVKIDMIYTVSIDRLSLVKLNKKKIIPVLEEVDFTEIILKFKKYFNI